VNSHELREYLRSGPRHKPDSALRCLADAHYMHVVNKAGWRVREALIGVLFRKVTWLSPGTKATYSTGKITNMMSSDCDRLRFVVTQLNLLWIIPVQVRSADSYACRFGRSYLLQC
jgi:hypothetical protein